MFHFEYNNISRAAQARPVLVLIYPSSESLSSSLLQHAHKVVGHADRTAVGLTLLFLMTASM